MTDPLEDFRGLDGKFLDCVYPGGYPVVYLDAEGHQWCPRCASQEESDPPITQAYTEEKLEAVIECSGCPMILQEGEWRKLA